MKRAKLWIALAVPSIALIWSSGAEGQAHADAKAITEADCTVSKMGDRIPSSAIGEPVSAVTLNVPRWSPAAGTASAYCSVDGAIAPVGSLCYSKADQLSSGFSGVVERACGTDGRCRDERLYSAGPGGRAELAAIPRLRYLRQ